MRFCGQCQRTQNKRVGRDCMCGMQPAPNSPDPSTRTASTVPSGTKRRRLQKHVDELQTKPMRRHRALEIFTWLMTFAAIVLSGCWKSVGSGSHKTGYDLYIPEVHKKILEVHKRETPEEVILAPECTPWSQMQNQNAKHPNQTKKRRVARGAEREFCNESNALTDKCGKYYVLEQPKGSQMPK